MLQLPRLEPSKSSGATSKGSRVASIIKAMSIHITCTHFSLLLVSVSAWMCFLQGRSFDAAPLRGSLCHHATAGCRRSAADHPSQDWAGGCHRCCRRHHNCCWFAHRASGKRGAPYILCSFPCFLVSSNPDFLPSACPRRVHCSLLPYKTSLLDSNAQITDHVS